MKQNTVEIKKFSNTICVIGVWFGEFPNYFPLWLKSCAANPMIDFIVFTDNDVCFLLPANVRFVKFSLKQMKELAIEKTKIKNISLERPYKCCDFKPLYGEIFQDYIATYEYWGHCDFDMLFGDLYTFLCDNNYREYDKFSNLGHLSFYRNTTDVNHYYVKDGSAHRYDTVLTTDKSFAFDENSCICQIYIKNHLPFFTKRLYADISCLYRRFRLSEYCSLDKKSVNYKYQIFYWDNGKTYRDYIDKNGEVKTEEFFYLHFQKRPNFSLSFDPDAVKSFYVTKQGFFPKRDKTTKKKIEELNKYIWQEDVLDRLKIHYRWFINRMRYLMEIVLRKKRDA